MRVLGIAGMSVTMPHKTDVADAVDRLDPAARSLRSVNTVSWDGDELVGSSTDGAGFVASLAEVGIDVDGGAGRRDRRRRRGPIGDRRARPRRHERHHRAQPISGQTPNAPPSWPPPRRSASSATSPAPTSSSTRRASGWGSVPAGAGVDDLPCDPALLHPEQVVVDLVYHPLRTAWLAAADAVGCPHRRRSRHVDPSGRAAAAALARHAPGRGRDARRRRIRPARPLKPRRGERTDRGVDLWLTATGGRATGGGVSRGDG